MFQTCFCCTITPVNLCNHWLSNQKLNCLYSIWYQLHLYLDPKVIHNLQHSFLLLILTLRYCELIIICSLPIVYNFVYSINLKNGIIQRLFVNLHLYMMFLSTATADFGYDVIYIKNKYLIVGSQPNPRLTTLRYSPLIVNRSTGACYQTVVSRGIKQIVTSPCVRSRQYRSITNIARARVLRTNSTMQKSVTMRKLEFTSRTKARSCFQFTWT